MRHAKIMAAVMAAVLTVSAFMPVCAMADVNVSDRMVGEGKLIEKTDGLTRLDDAERASFIDALDKKYECGSRRGLCGQRAQFLIYS